MNLVTTQCMNRKGTGVQLLWKTLQQGTMYMYAVYSTTTDTTLSFRLTDLAIQSSTQWGCISQKQIFAACATGFHRPDDSQPTVSKQ